MEELETKLESVNKEERRAEIELQATEGVIREREVELVRLGILEATLRSQLDALNLNGDSGDRSENDATGGGSLQLSPELKELQENLTQQAIHRVTLIRGADGIAGMAFSFQAEKGIKIFTPAALISDNPGFSVETIDGDRLEIESEISCPTGVELIGLHPKHQQLDSFQLVESSRPPTLGDHILVITYSQTSKTVTGTTGRIRGIGPDVWELDADLTPEMTGSPVISLKSGKVIGIVAPQVAGVASDWALGTRHQQARNFAARLDHIQDWQSINLGRFRNESSHIRNFENVTHMAWVGHCMLNAPKDYKTRIFVSKEAEKNKDHPVIKQFNRWRETPSIV